MSKFKITNHKGFRMGFENGFEISVQWGPGNYCQRRDDDFDEPKRTDFWKSCNAEIAVFNAEGGFLKIGKSDTVLGWISADQVAKVISIIQSAKTEEEIELKIKTLRL